MNSATQLGLELLYETKTALSATAIVYNLEQRID